jgi:hypothetical protein
VHGVIAVPQLRRVYASATDAREVITLDSRTGKVIARAPAGQYPDGLAYDPVRRAHRCRRPAHASRLLPVQRGSTGRPQLLIMAPQ